MKSPRVHEGLQQDHRMSKSFLPVDAQPLLAQRKDARSQVGDMILREDQETAVIGQKVQAIILMAEVPSDPTLTDRALPGSGRKAQKGYPFITPGGHVPKVLADFGQSSQVVKGLHSLLETLLLRRENGPDKDFLQVQDNHPPDHMDKAQRVQYHIPHPSGNVQNYM